MSRRLRLPSWVEDKEPPAKPLPPLRHRISRTEKALDELDALEAELYKTDLESDDWAHLEQLISVKRSKLAKALDRELGATLATPKQAKPLRTPHRGSRGHTRHSRPMLSNGVQWFIFVCIMAAIFF